jgi:hypothetical protein
MPKKVKVFENKIIKRDIGRPTDYNEKIADEICGKIATSSKGVPTLCKENSDWPNETTVYRWMKKHEDFRLKYLLAKKAQAEIRVDEIEHLLHDESQDFYYDKDNKPYVNTAYIARLKLLVQVRQWHASKLLPKVFGEKVEATIKNEVSKEVLENIRYARNQAKKI